jgi:hypothetical protein
MALPGVHARERVRCGGATWLAPRAEAPNLTEPETREALSRLEPLWDELFPGEQAPIVRALVERVVLGLPEKVTATRSRGLVVYGGGQTRGASLGPSTSGGRAILRRYGLQRRTDTRASASAAVSW